MKEREPRFLNMWTRKRKIEILKASNPRDL